MADLGAGAHNLARFSRWGRFLALAGFGNLPGDLVVYEKKDGATWKQLAATRSIIPLSAPSAPPPPHTTPPPPPPRPPKTRPPTRRGARKMLYVGVLLRKARAGKHACTLSAILMITERVTIWHFFQSVQIPERSKTLRSDRGACNSDSHRTAAAL